jgi:pyruvate/2-oxoacid:ferredoxin oxidoreductase alpha subunit
MGAFDLRDSYQLPLILFFNLRDSDVEDVEVYPLQQSNLAFAFEEVFRIVEDYVKKMTISQTIVTKENRAWIMMKKISKVAGDKALEIVIDKAMERIGKGIGY